jgi:hypothetical protein
MFYSRSRVRSSWATRSGSARKSSSTILPFRTVTAAIENGCPWRKVTIPAAPLMSARAAWSGRRAASRDSCPTSGYQPPDFVGGPWFELRQTLGSA